MTPAWIVLRTAGRSTLRLAETLAADGFEVWTPKRSVKVRKPRWNVHRDVTLPLMASFVFAADRHLEELLEMANREAAPRRGWRPAHPPFSVFHHFDRVPLVADADLRPLRDLEAAPATPDELRDIFRPGEKVLVGQGIFGGMAGVVERSDGTFTLVRFGSRMRVKISTFVLKPILAHSRNIAAKAA